MGALAGKKSKKGTGIGDKALGLLGVVGSALSAPQQVLFKGAKGLRELGSGDLGGLRTLAGAAGEVATLGQAGGDIEFTEAIGAEKLPFGLETAAQLALDPLNLVTFGAGTAAKQGLRMAPKVIGKEATERLATGGLRALSEAEQATLRAGTTDKVMKGLARRAQGGVGVRGFETPLLSGRRAAEIGEATGLTAAKNVAKASAPIRGLRHAFSPGAAVATEKGQSAADALLEAGSRRLSEESARKVDLATRLDAIRDSFEEATGRAFGDEEDKLLQQALESGDLEAAISASPELARAARASDDIRRTLTKEQVERNLLASVRDEDSYLHRTETPEAAEALGRAARGGGVAGGSVGASLRQSAAKARTFAPDSTVDEINRAIDLIQRGEQVPDGMLRDSRLVEKLQESLQRRLDDIEAQADEIRQRNIDGPRTGELTRAQERKLAADAENLRRMQTEINREAKRLGAADASRTAGVAGRGRESLEQARQLGLGDASRKRQLALRARRLEKSAAKAKAPATRALRQDAADEARAASDVLKGVAKPKTVKEVNREITRQAGLAAARTDAEGRSIARMVSRREHLSEAAAERAAKYKEAAGRRVVRQDEKRLAQLDQQSGRVMERMAEKSKEAEELTLDTAHKIAQTLPTGTKLYSESALEALLERGNEAHKAIATAEFIADARAIKGADGAPILLSADDVAQGAALPADAVKFELPKLGVFHASPAVKAEITKFHAVIGADGAVEGFDRFIRQAHKWWKTMVTVHPAGGIPFSLRNARTNVFLMFGDGMNPRWMKDGWDFAKNVRRIKRDFAGDIADHGVDFVMKRELGDEAFALYKAAPVGQGFYHIDFDGGVDAAKAATGGKAKRALRAALGSEGAASKKGRQINSAIEDHARLSHFLYSADRLGNLEDAAARTNTVLFDYGRITPFAQRRIKPVVPFYTFASKVVPAQFRAIIENPARIIVPEKISKLTTEPLGEDAPEYQRRLGARVSKLPGIAGMITTPERPLQAAVKSLEPLSQVLAAVIPGKQGRLEPEQGVPQAVRSAISMFGGAPGSQIKALVEEGGNVDLFTGYRLANKESRQRILTELVPPLGRIPRFVAEKLPDAVVEKRRKGRGGETEPLISDLAAILGIKIQSPTKAQR